MTPGPRLPDFLRHMQEAVENTLHYTVAMDEAAFLADARTQQAVYFNFVILGEACTRLMAHHAEFLRLHPHVPWRSIRDMRNQVAHGYFTICRRRLAHGTPCLAGAAGRAARRDRCCGWACGPGQTVFTAFGSVAPGAWCTRSMLPLL